MQAANDLRVAVESGVDVIAHMLGNRGRPEPIDSTVAAAAAQKGIAVIASAGLAVVQANGDSIELDSAVYRRTRESQIDNLRLLRTAGVNVIIGSDVYSGTSVGRLSISAGSASTPMPNC